MIPALFNHAGPGANVGTFTSEAALTIIYKPLKYFQTVNSRFCGHF